jgi:hypothetical protein
MMPDSPVPVPRREQFDQFFRGLGQGAFNHECTKALAEVTRACSQHAQNTNGKAKAKLTITLELSLDRGVFDIGSEVSIKVPKSVRGRTIAFEVPGGGLSLSNPQQMELGVTPRDTAVEQERHSPRDLAAGDRPDIRAVR